MPGTRDNWDRVNRHRHLRASGEGKSEKGDMSSASEGAAKKGDPSGMVWDGAGGSFLSFVPFF